MPFKTAKSDLDRIQTCNLLSRNQVRYSVAPRGLFAGANIGLFLKKRNTYLNKLNWISPNDVFIKQENGRNRPFPVFETLYYLI